MGIISVLILIVCVLLVLVVLVQNSKGGGLASGFASNNQIMGVRRTSDFLEKATWGLAGALLILSLFATPKSVAPGEGTETAGSVTKGRANTSVPAPAANTKPAAPVNPGK
ncbi:MAG TPA: preprotein translocase subunit SecG [Bacteroidia bacterium]